MKTSKLILLATLGSGLVLSGTRAQTVLSAGHTDIGLAYEDGAWDLHVHSHESDTEYAPDEAILRLDLSSARPIPAGASYSFLGAAGSTFYVLPQVQEPSLLFLGLAAEEIAPGDFTGDTLRMTLKSVSGPGNFSLYLVDGFGVATAHMNSGNGIDDSTDFYNVTAGSHTDLNWAFSAPGSYTIGFEASGTHGVDGPVTSGIVNYSFEVVPEPSTLALLGLAVAFGLLRGNRK